MEQLENSPPQEGASVIVVGNVGWNPGVLGIVASKLVEKYYRPAIVLGFDEEKVLQKDLPVVLRGSICTKSLQRTKILFRILVDIQWLRV